MLAVFFCIIGVQIYKVTLIMQHYFIRITLSYNWYSCYVKSVSMNNHVGYKNMLQLKIV